MAVRPVKSVGISGLIKRLETGIFFQVLLGMLLVSLLPLAGFWWFNTQQAERDLSATIETMLGQSAGGLVTKVDDWLDLNVRMLKQNASLGSVSSMTRAEQEPILESMVSAYEWLYLTFVIGQDGYKIARSDQQAILKDGAPAHFRGDRAYFQDVMQGEAVGQEVLISRTTGLPAVCLSVPVGKSATPVGVLASCSQLGEVSAAVVNTRIGETGFAFLVDDAGRLVAHGSPDVLSGTLQDFSQHPAVLQARSAKAENSLFSYGAKDERVVAYAQETQLGWTLVVQQDYAEAFAPLRRSRRLALGLLLLSAVIVIAAALILARKMARPLEHLSSVAEEISRGGLEQPLSQTLRKDEIGSLARAIERLRISVAIAVNELHK